VPSLSFRIEGAEAAAFAAAPTLLFRLGIENAGGEPIRSISLNVQLRISPAQRRYSAGEQTRLRDLFGEPQQWSTTLRSLLWTQATLVVPPFEGAIAVELPIACTYDFEVASAKYFAALEGGEIPIELLFSGTVFYPGSDGLQVVQLPWDREARCRLPVALWREAIDRHFPDSAWLRLRRDAFDRLSEYRARRALPTWDAAIEALLAAAEQEVER